MFLARLLNSTRQGKRARFCVCIFYELPSRVRQTAARSMAKEEGDDLLPDKDAAKGFYAKYEPKEILGRCVAVSYIALLVTVKSCPICSTAITYYFHVGASDLEAPIYEIAMNLCRNVDIT